MLNPLQIKIWIKHEKDFEFRIKKWIGMILVWIKSNFDQLNFDHNSQLFFLLFSLYIYCYLMAKLRKLTQISIKTRDLPQTRIKKRILMCFKNKKWIKSIIRRIKTRKINLKEPNWNENVNIRNNKDTYLINELNLLYQMIQKWLTCTKLVYNINIFSKDRS